MHIRSHYVASWNRAEVRMPSGTCYTINSHGQDYILNKYLSIVVAKYIFHLFFSLEIYLTDDKKKNV